VTALAVRAMPRDSSSSRAEALTPTGDDEALE